ncbi:polyprenyl diphosphate synthase [Psittacicella hinzii]|uniref:Ditrans,polycis-undecaprenyl-diphosphate synthase ((2E,6E)-farnesyl-diphosphate specific) n=1 Tax=Psittacicella hinzii TaxID=2028575 RepID=A0A3A1YJH6_9GAMM|nr:polyprenyl diphosphate synthase [Psittacicella hinzii]RIY36177.1 di-trans,poly-cis-decaprenylcistransferase [Psittacicella hinzii]
MTTNHLNMPKHVAIIMDGSGRWAKARNKSRKSGHNAGALAVRRTIEYAATHNIASLSLYAFSKENWKRPKEEVEHLMKLFLRVLKNNKKFLLNLNVRFTPIGDIDVFSDELKLHLQKLIDDTKQNTGLRLNIAVNYSGRWDIYNASSKVCTLALDELQTYLQANPALTALQISQKLELLKQKYRNEEFFTSLLEQNLTVADQDPIDLIIRTSNEQRISNFFLWQAAYSEFVFLEQYWPDFGPELFAKAIDLFSQRVRRFGGV